VGRENSPPPFAPPRPAAAWPADSSRAPEFRALALQRAKVWHPPDLAESELASNPPDPTGALSQPIVRCRFLSKPAHGTTPKFDCVLPDGEVVKVKYGPTGFEWAAVERRFDGAEIDGTGERGWAWWELDQVDPAVGASRAELDALRVTAMFLAHWDNKASNQRLVCLAPRASSPAPCPRAFAIIQDLGATVGPNKVDLQEWQATPIWADEHRCTISMRKLPYNGGTFPDVQITEAGRQLIARQLAALGEHQIVSLFSAARFREFHRGAGPGADLNAWAQAFRDKVRQIAAAGPCPS
jgi:hypothetical protein